MSLGRNDELPVGLRLCLGDPFCPFDGSDVAVSEDPPDGRIVVESDEPFPFEQVEPAAEFVDIDDAPSGIHPGIAGGVWRIEEEERLLPIVEIEASLPVEIFDSDPVEPEVELSDRLHS